MAIAKDIIDERGVKTRYHKIHSFAVVNGLVKITMRSYVNINMRDAEKKAIAENAKAEKYWAEVESLKDQLSALSGADNTDEIKKIAEKLNALSLDPDAPKFVKVVDRYTDESIIDVSFEEQLSMKSLYEQLTQTDRYFDGKSI